MSAAMAKVRKPASRSKTQRSVVKKPTVKELQAAAKNTSKFMVAFKAMDKAFQKHFPEDKDVLDLAHDVVRKLFREHGGAPDALVMRWWCGEMNHWEEFSSGYHAYIRRVIDRWMDPGQVELEFYPVCCILWGMVDPEDEDVLEVKEWACRWLESYEM